MIIIEFFGLPYSGKSYFAGKLKNVLNKDKKVFNIKTLNLFYLAKKNFSLFILSYYFKYRFVNNDKQNIKIKEEKKRNKNFNLFKRFLLRKIFFKR